jgi:molecular chaperone GrpE
MTEEREGDGFDLSKESGESEEPEPFYAAPSLEPELNDSDYLDLNQVLGLRKLESGSGNIEFEKLRKEGGSLKKENESLKKGSEALEQENETLKTEVGDLKNQLAAARADLYNYRQRTERERLKTLRMLTLDRVGDFLPVLDNLDRALSVPEDVAAKDVLTGVRMVQRQFLSILEEAGVTCIPTEGHPFDPLLHDAIETETVDDPEQDGRVLRELSRGYRAPERVLRAARVRVGSFKAKTQEAQAPEEAGE